MSAFPVESLSKVCDITMGQAPKGTSYNTTGSGYALIAGAGDFGELTPEPSKYTDAPTKLSRPGDLILCIRATIGNRNWSDSVYCLGRGVAGLRAKDAALSQAYLWHWIEHAAPMLKAKGRGATFLQVSKNDIASLEIPVPPLADQKRIAGILDAADALRAKRRESLAQLDTLIQSTFLDLFGDPVTNPMGWEVRALGDLANNEDGKRVPVKKIDREKMTGGFPYYGASGIIDSVDSYLFDGERLLIGEDGANLVARSTPIAFIAKGKYWVNNHAHVLAFSGTAKLIFLEAMINAIDLKPYLSGTAQPKLNQKSLNRIPIATPPLDLQHRFATIVESIEQQKTLSRTHLAELDTLFASLQARAFNGEL